MDIFLTGGSGFVGSAVLAALVRDGHTVRALARSDESAKAVAGAGAQPVRGELTDTDVLAREAAAGDGMIHTGSPGDQSSADVDAALLDAVLPVLAGKRYVHTSGVWIHGNSNEITEETPFAPPPVTSWRLPLDARVREAADDGVGSVVIAPGIVYGHGGGLPGVLKSGPQHDGALQYPGGHQHWTTVYVDDLADLYVRALTDAPAGSYYLGVNGTNPDVADLATASAKAQGLDRAEVESDDSGQQRLGPMYAALLLDQQATGAHARELGWTPAGPSLIDEMSSGSYA